MTQAVGWITGNPVCESCADLRMQGRWKMHELLTSTGVFFTYTAAIPDRAKLQIVEFTIDSPFTANAPVVAVNVSSLALIGRTVETVLADHVEHYERRAAGDAASHS